MKKLAIYLLFIAIAGLATGFLLNELFTGGKFVFEFLVLAVLGLAGTSVSWPFQPIFLKRKN